MTMYGKKENEKTIQIRQKCGVLWDKVKNIVLRDGEEREHITKTEYDMIDSLLCMIDELFLMVGEDRKKSAAQDSGLSSRALNLRLQEKKFRRELDVAAKGKNGSESMRRLAELETMIEIERHYSEMRFFILQPTEKPVTCMDGVVRGMSDGLKTG